MSIVDSTPDTKNWDLFPEPNLYSSFCLFGSGCPPSAPDCGLFRFHAQLLLLLCSFSCSQDLYRLFFDPTVNPTVCIEQPRTQR